MRTSETSPCAAATASARDRSSVAASAEVRRPRKREFDMKKRGTKSAIVPRSETRRQRSAALYTLIDDAYSVEIPLCAAELGRSAFGEMSRFGLFVGVIRRAYQRADGGVAESECVGLALKHGECVRMHVTRYRQMAGAGLEILPDGEHLDLVRAHVAHDRENLLVGFAEAHHQAGLGRNLREALLELLQQLERMPIVRARPGLLVEARHGLEIVVHHVGRAFRKRVQSSRQTAPEIRH